MAPSRRREGAEASPGSPGAGRGATIAPMTALRRRPALLAGAVLVFAAVVAVHAPVLDARAVSIDDDQYLLDNPLVARPTLESFRRIFGEVLAPSAVRGYYHPLGIASLALDARLAGGVRDFRPFHRTSLLLHAVNAVLVMLVVAALLEAPWAGVAAGLLWGL